MKDEVKSDSLQQATFFSENSHDFCDGSLPIILDKKWEQSRNR